MKRTLLFCCAAIGMFLSSFAHPIDLEDAKAIAYKFMITNDLQLSTTYLTDKNVAAFYVFNTTNGFIIISADDCETPIIGYSHEGRFDPNNVPVQMEDYLQDFVARMQYNSENQVEADEIIARLWEKVKATGRLNEWNADNAVEPLLTEKWHQGCLYNSLCPEMQGPCNHAEAGCVAVAMGQIMHYWKYPSSGWGSNFYYNQGIQLSANFGNTTYDWSHMPDSLTDNSSEAEVEAVATLLYHCGVAVRMRYSVTGSNANLSDAADALMRYFDYTRQLRQEKKNNYDEETWKNMLKDNLNQQRPILYSGFGSVGHAFVCDGYDDNGLFHFNWGWGGNGDGYFTIGNLNPNGNQFNSNNLAILDIIPQYEPCHVAASAYPPNAGAIEGNGEYHIGELCRLTAVSTENTKFLYWKEGDRVVSNDTFYEFEVKDDTHDIVACFNYMPVAQITASYAPDASNPNSPCVSLSWDYADSQWALLKQFELNGEHGVATDENYIYVCNYSQYSSSPMFGKYTMEGELIELFMMEGVYPSGITSDGNYFYCSNNRYSHNVFHLYCYDLGNKTLIDSTNMHMQLTLCSYDSENDGFWLCNSIMNYQFILKDRQGQTLMMGPNFSPHWEYSLCGSGTIIAKDGTSHLLIIGESGEIYDYDISNGILINQPGLGLKGLVQGASIGKYDGKDAFFVIVGDYQHSHTALHIFEINSHLSQIIGYQIYRSDSEGHTMMLTDGITESSYIDSTWNEASAGVYRFGISPIYANGHESEIIWSNSIVKSGIGVEEHTDQPTGQDVQKIFENGQIIIIKDGERYNVSGQKMN